MLPWCGDPWMESCNQSSLSKVFSGESSLLRNLGHMWVMFPQPLYVLYVSHVLFSLRTKPHLCLLRCLVSHVRMADHLCMFWCLISFHIWGIHGSSIYELHHSILLWTFSRLGAWCVYLRKRCGALSHSRSRTTLWSLTADQKKKSLSSDPFYKRCLPMLRVPKT